jgi:hypothetical protein
MNSQFNVFGTTVAVFIFMAGMASAEWKIKKTVGNKTTVTGDAQTMEREAADEKAREQHLAELRNMERRQPTDPISVALYRPTFSENMKKSADPEKLFQMMKEEFQKDPLIQLVDQKTVDRAQKQVEKDRSFSSGENLPSVQADISVFTHVMAEEKVGISKSTKKLGTMMALVMKAKIVSHYLPEDRYSHEEAGNIFANAQVVKTYAEKCGGIIKTKPALPSPAYKQKMANQQNQALADGLKSLFKKKNPEGTAK